MLLLFGHKIKLRNRITHKENIEFAQTTTNLHSTLVYCDSNCISMCNFGPKNRLLEFMASIAAVERLPVTHSYENIRGHKLPSQPFVALIDIQLVISRICMHATLIDVNEFACRGAKLFITSFLASSFRLGARLRELSAPNARRQRPARRSRLPLARRAN